MKKYAVTGVTVLIILGLGWGGAILLDTLLTNQDARTFSASLSGNTISDAPPVMLPDPNMSETSLSIAPDFSLSVLDQEDKVTLSSFRSQTPVLLIFGSCT